MARVAPEEDSGAAQEAYVEAEELATSSTW